jgi:broad specificity phosphatase PhoE
MPEQTRIHLVRHGEAHNPQGVLYGRLSGFHLSDKGIRQAEAVADMLAQRDIVAVIASPLERAQETAAPIAARHGLPVNTDPDLIESTNFFEGRHLGPGDGAWRDPRVWWRLRNPFTPSWGGADDDRGGQGPRASRRPRGGMRQPPAAGVDAATGGYRQATLARSAATPVRGGIGDVAGL